MKQIKTFFQNNSMVIVSVMAVMLFGTCMYSAHQNMVEREARIEKVIASGGSYHPSENLKVDGSYMAECGD